MFNAMRFAATAMLLVVLTACGGGGTGGGAGSSTSSSSNSSSSSSSSNSSSSSGSSSSDSSSSSSGGTPIDTAPDAFSFEPLTGVERSAVVASNPISVTGINAPAVISISGGRYSIDGGAYTADSGTVDNGQEVRVHLTSSSEYSTVSSITLTIGGVSAVFSVTTMANPAVPDAFTFTDVTNAELSTLVVSEPVTVSGLNTSANIGVLGGEYSVDGGVFTAAASTVQSGDTVRVRLLSSATPETTVSAALTVGGVSDSFDVTTRAGDIEPDAIDFADITDALPGTDYDVGPVTVTGIDIATPVAVSGCVYSLDGAAHTDQPGSILNGQSFGIRMTAPAQYEDTALCNWSVGSLDGATRVSTGPEDGTPDAFSFMDIDDAVPGEWVTSGPVPITGFNTGIVATVTGGEISLNGVDYTDGLLPVPPAPDRQLWVRAYAPAYNNASTDIVVEVGGVADTFTVSTADADTTPDAFSFEDIDNVGRRETIESDPVTIGGMDGIALLTVAGGEYSLDGGVSFSSETAPIGNGESVIVRRASAAGYAQTVGVTLTVGGVSDTFDITTEASPPVITALQPAWVVEDGAAFTLTVQGAYFSNDSIVRWDGNERSTTYVSSTELDATINAADIQSASNVVVTVYETSDDRESDPVNFVVRADPSPDPQSLTAVTPDTATVGDNATTITIAGAGFTGSSVALLDGTVLETTYQSASQLTATVPASMLLSDGCRALTVATPEASNPVTGPLTFFVIDAGDSLFFDDFERSDSPDIGNGWTEKRPDTFSLSGGMVVSVEQAGEGFNDVIVYRPETEDARDVEAGVEFVRIASDDPRFPQVHVRISRTGEDNVAIDDALVSYAAFLYDEASDQALAITPIDGASECYLNRFPLNEALVVGERYRLRFRVVGGEPVRMMAYFEHFAVDRWETLAHGGIVHDEDTEPVQDFWCTMGDIPDNPIMADPYVHSGATGFAKYIYQTDNYDRFYSIRLTDTDNPVAVLTNLQPVEAETDGDAFTLEVGGIDFFPGAVVRWNGEGLPTTYVSGAMLEAEVSAMRLSAVGDVEVTVFNPPPGGGESNPLVFSVTP